MQFTPVCDSIIILRNYYLKKINSLDVKGTSKKKKKTVFRMIKYANFQFSYDKYANCSYDQVCQFSPLLATP